MIFSLITFIVDFTINVMTKIYYKCEKIKYYLLFSELPKIIQAVIIVNSKLHLAHPEKDSVL